MPTKGRNKPKRKPNKNKTPKMPKSPNPGSSGGFGRQPLSLRSRVSPGFGGSKLGLGSGSAAFSSPVGPRVEKLLDSKRRKKATQQATPRRKR